MSALCSLWLSHRRFSPLYCLPQHSTLFAYSNLILHSLVQSIQVCCRIISWGAVIGTGGSQVDLSVILIVDLIGLYSSISTIYMPWFLKAYNLCLYWPGFFVQDISCCTVQCLFIIILVQSTAPKVIELRSRIPDCIQCVTYCTSSVCSVTRWDVHLSVSQIYLYGEHGDKVMLWMYFFYQVYSFCVCFFKHMTAKMICLCPSSG